MTDVFIKRTVSPYELTAREREHLLDLARAIMSGVEPTFTPPETVCSETRERTPYLHTVTTRYGDAQRGFEVTEHQQSSHGLPKEAGRSLKVSAYGFARARVELHSSHWPGHSDAGRGVSIYVTGPDDVCRAVLGVVEKMEERRRQCPNGGLLAGMGDVLPEDPRELARPGHPLGCNRLRCAQCGAFVRHDARAGKRAYACDCAKTEVDRSSEPLRGDCDTSYDATWWCAGHPSTLDEIEALDRALPPPWSAWREAHASEPPWEPSATQPEPIATPRRARASDYYQIVASDFGVTVEPTPAKTRDEFLHDLRHASSREQIDAATALRAFGRDAEVVRALVDVCNDPALADAATHSLFEMLGVDWLGFAPIQVARDLVVSGAYSKGRYFPRPKTARRLGLRWLRELVERKCAGDEALDARRAAGLTKLAAATTEEDAARVIADFPELR